MNDSKLVPFFQEKTENVAYPGSINLRSFWKITSSEMTHFSLDTLTRKCWQCSLRSGFPRALPTVSPTSQHSYRRACCLFSDTLNAFWCKGNSSEESRQVFFIPSKLQFSHLLYVVDLFESTVCTRQGVNFFFLVYGHMEYFLLLLKEIRSVLL